MGAPMGNEFWKMREKHGRDKIFDTPEKLWNAAVSYFEYVDSHPEMEIDYRGKDAVEVQLPKKQPYTMQGLCLFLGVNTKYYVDFKHSLAGKVDQTSKEFSLIIRDIEDTVYNQKFAGAASGFFNANIIARDLGLSEKQEVRSEVKVEAVDYSKLSEATLKEIDQAAEPEEDY